MKSYIQSGQNIIVHGERRMGKTSLVRHVISSMRGIRLLYIDLYCIRTLSDFCRRVLAGLAASNESMSFLKKAINLVHRLRPAISFDPANGSPSISIDARAADEPESLEAVMGMIRKLSV
ncbi:MAG: ATP-binding protein, partial [Victivallales bacterium]|nr:ATP-binding protein [Victivallales bacterium]